VEEGVTLVLGGTRVEDRKGYFFYPTILTNVADGTFVAQEESFGPIMIISKFDGSKINEVIARANATEFGLASGVFTSNINKALLVVQFLFAISLTSSRARDWRPELVSSTPTTRPTWRLPLGVSSSLDSGRTWERLPFTSI
jgi:hypothetical protein